MKNNSIDKSPVIELLQKLTDSLLNKCRSGSLFIYGKMLHFLYDFAVYTPGNLFLHIHRTKENPRLESPIVKRKREAFKPVQWNELLTEKEAETIWQAILMHSLHEKVENIIQKKLERMSQGWFR